MDKAERLAQIMFEEEREISRKTYFFYLQAEHTFARSRPGA